MRLRYGTISLYNNINFCSSNITAQLASLSTPTTLMRYPRLCTSCDTEKKQITIWIDHWYQERIDNPIIPKFIVFLILLFNEGVWVGARVLVAELVCSARIHSCGKNVWSLEEASSVLSFPTNTSIFCDSHNHVGLVAIDNYRIVESIWLKGSGSSFYSWICIYIWRGESALFHAGAFFRKHAQLALHFILPKLG